MIHSTKVAKAIYAALHDIRLLRKLDEAADYNAAGVILAKYDTGKKKKGIDLDESERKEFWTSLKEGKTLEPVDVHTLVKFYDDLEPKRGKKATRGKPPDNEWKP